MVLADRQSSIAAILDCWGRKHATATVMFHHAVAESFGLGATDHKCLDLLRDRPAMTASELASLTGLTTGAVTGVVARLERRGYLRREPDPDDRRKQTLHPNSERVEEIHDAVEPLRRDLTTVLDRFDERQLEAIAAFLAESTQIALRNAALLRARASVDGPGERAGAGAERQR